MKQEVKFSKRGYEFLFWVVLTFGFLISIGGFFVQFHSNQNTHMLRGLVAGGIDSLSEDWYANTEDPMPVFGFLVQITSKFLGSSIFYLIQLFLIGIYIYSLISIIDYFFNIRRSASLFFSFITIFYLTNSYAFYEFTLVNPYTGLAGQSFEFNYFLPNSFGAALFLSILLFLRKKYVWAILSLCLAGYFHNGYLIAGALLTASYMIIEFRETRTVRKSFFLGLFALIIISPIVIDTLNTNDSANFSQILEAARIMVLERIPHHTLVKVWWRYYDSVKLILCLLSLILMRKLKIFPLLLLAFLITFLSVAAALIRPISIINLLMIWRASVMLIPLSTTLLLGALINFLFTRKAGFIQSQQRSITILLILISLFVLFQGFQIQSKRIKTAADRPQIALFNFIKQEETVDPVYLIPPRDLELQGFRLETGSPIFVDWKSHPWNSLEFLIWDHRISVADNFYAKNGIQACAEIPGLVDTYQITHILTTISQTLDCQELSLIYQDENYKLYRIMRVD